MQLSNSPNDVQKEYIRHSKILIILSTLNSIMLIVACILASTSSSNLSNQYEFIDGLQDVTLVFAIISAIFLFVSIVASLNSRISQPLRIAAMVFSLIFLSVVIGLLMGSLVLSLLNVYCGYFISHNGDADGSYIATALQTNYQYPSCYTLENNGLSVQNQLNVLSITIITSYCQVYTGQSHENCMDLSSLSVTDWSTVFSTLLAAIIMASVGYFFFIVFSVALSVRLKNVKNNVQRQTAALLQNQIASQQQFYIVQPQIGIPVPSGQIQQQQQYIPQGVYLGQQGNSNMNYNNPNYVNQQQQYGNQQQQQPYNPYYQSNNQQ